MDSSSACHDASMMFGADADRRPRALAVGGVDQHPRDRAGGRRAVEDAHLVVGEVDAVELRVAAAERGPQRVVDAR